MPITLNFRVAAITAAVSLLCSATAMAAEADASDNLANIKPVGSVNVAGQAPAAATPAPAAAAPEAAAPAPEAAAAAPAPAAEAEAAPAVAAAAPAPAGAVDGEAIYNKTCMACHLTGAANAPKLGDKAAWDPRVAKGIDALYASAINGIPGTGMMAKGTCMTCTDEELKAAVDYMVSKL